MVGWLPRVGRRVHRASAAQAGADGAPPIELDYAAMTTLCTERLELRPLTAQDLGQVIALGTDPRVMAPLGGPLTAFESRTWLEHQLEHLSEHGYGRQVVTCEGQFVGLVGLSRRDFDRGIVPGIEVAWRLAFDHWGHGYATEAARAVLDQGFTHFDLREVIAVTTVGNQRSLSVMLRLGMLPSPVDTFDHPLLPEGDPLRKHLVYRLSRP